MELSGRIVLAMALASDRGNHAEMGRMGEECLLVSDIKGNRENSRGDAVIGK